MAKRKTATRTARSSAGKTSTPGGRARKAGSGRGARAKKGVTMRLRAPGRAVGVDYEDNEELKSAKKIERRDKKRWELDPASAEDYKERNRKR